ncbi:MAG TPA: family 43 glycosylhydrolase [Candidatus Eisenbergiella pullicola]|nr:family 43 glycosylhydrolase [Candidatus Eisenbergiella pullicola]
MERSGLFYRPVDGVCGDFIPYYEAPWYYLFYLKDFRDREKRGEGCPWYCVRSRDLLHWEELGEMLPRGTAQEQDLFVYTGSVFRDIEGDGAYHIFYTGHNPYFKEKGKPQEAILHAVSEDLMHWKKDPEFRFLALEGYEPDDWRDPFVFRDEKNGRYAMLVTARKDRGRAAGRGVTALCVSDDLKCWSGEKNLWEPDRYVTHECGELFRMGEWWYLIYSEFSDRFRTRYVMAKSPEGPFFRPERDCFDSRAFYAAKTLWDGRKRYLFGWLASREGEADSGNWQWGGNMLVHELYQKEDKSLAVRMPEAFRNRAELSLDFSFQMESENTEIRLWIPGRDGHPGYELLILPLEKKMALRTAGRLYPDPDFCGIETAAELNAGVWHRISILFQESCMAAYLDGQRAMSARLYGRGKGTIELRYDGERVLFSDLDIHEGGGAE